jgi:hypothetical protein
MTAGTFSAAGGEAEAVSLLEGGAGYAEIAASIIPRRGSHSASARFT